MPPAGEVVERIDGRPLPGVVVSDGLAVTRTRDDGSFSLPDRADAEFVWATVPSTHRALEGAWFADVRDGPSAPVRLELDRRDGLPHDGCRFVQVTDLHVSVDGGARLRPLIEAGVRAPNGVQVTGEVSGDELRADLHAIVERVHPELVIATGDIADYGQREELEAYCEAISGLAVPVASVPGNHDHLSCLTREAIDEFFGTWAARTDTEGLSATEEFSREVFGGDWRRPDAGRRPWLEVIGPLYYSFDWGGVHFVVYDGEGRRRYGDAYPQDEWLAADLAASPQGAPVVVCTHFPEPAEFYRARFGGVRLVASICGHWHGTRVWRDGEAFHWTSSTVGFGGIDFTPRGYRVVEVGSSGARSRWETMEEPAPAGPRVTGAVSVAGDHVLVALEEPDTCGSVVALGEWTHELAVAARAGVAADGDSAYALDTGGSLVALDLRTGATRWTHELGDPSVRWCLGAPVPVDGRLYVGSAMSAHAFDASSGDQLWRTDLSDADWAASWSGVAVGPGVVVVGAASDDLHLAVLDADGGAVRWRHAGRDIAGVSTTPAVVADAVLAARVPGWLDAYALDDGERRWHVPLDDAWPVALTVSGNVAFVRTSSGTVTAHDVDTGDAQWTRALGGGARAGRPYSRALAGARRPLVVVGDRVWTAMFDALVGLDAATGAVVSETDAGGELATVVARGSEVVGVTVDARLVDATA